MLINHLPSKPGEAQLLDNCQGLSASLITVEAAKKHTGLTVLVCPDNQQARRLRRECQFFASDLVITLFPDWETLPYDPFSPHQDIIANRLELLNTLPQIKQGLVIIPVTTLLQQLCPTAYVHGHTFTFKQGDELDSQRFSEQLTLAGYRRVETVYATAEYAIRGSIVDVYPTGSADPLRLDLLDDSIDSIRTFDPDTQRSRQTHTQFELLPAQEFPMTDAAISLFRQQWRQHFAGNPLYCPLYEEVSNGHLVSGLEYYLPLFFEQTNTLFDYLPAETLIVRTRKLQATMDQFWQNLNERFEQRRHDIERPILAPDQLYIKPEQAFSQIKQYPVIITQTETAENQKATSVTCQALPNLTIQKQTQQPLKTCLDFMRDKCRRTLIVADSAGRESILQDLFAKQGMPLQTCGNWQAFCDSDICHAITQGQLDQGLYLSDSSLAVIPEALLYGDQVLQRRRREQVKVADSAIFRDLIELKVGDPVVHIEHGIGRYCGLQRLNIDDVDTEFLTIEYQDKAKLYLPVTSIELISRYSGLDPDHAILSSLGSDHWQKTKQKALKKIEDVAANLLDIYAKRESKTGFVYQLPNEDFAEFCDAFPFEETPDQLRAIQTIIHDMTTSKAMDRLVCGDVGFGKTEVAMRAAYLATLSGKQVAVLVPTTLLANQHFQTFSDRFANTAVRMDVLSRFKTKREVDISLAKLTDGKIDIIIGTHKLLQPGIQFKDLGLLIVDEEHRFGVQHKEKIKNLRAEVDILTLTATPIPRTLNMSLSGLRDLSIIATPPLKRLSIKTFVQPRNQTLMTEAIQREVSRGGQVYLLHNEVKTITAVAEEIQGLVPTIKIAVAHGQMRERELEKVMIDFYHQRHQVLVCTTIIESGIDIPNANTMIIDRADKFGLAQLHQLRGRVGRSHHQAYAYLMTPQHAKITSDAKKRLAAIAELEDLGAGFQLANHDLEIRGAGEILGAEQSGHMQKIGFDLYMELLDRAVTALKQGKSPKLATDTSCSAEVELRIPALLTDDYIYDVQTRLKLYKRIARCQSATDCDELKAELIDRFGPLPKPTQNLLNLSRLKSQANHLGIRKIDAGKQSGRIEFRQDTPVEPEKVIHLVQSNPTSYRLTSANHLRFPISSTDASTRIQQVQLLLNQLQ